MHLGYLFQWNINWLFFICIQDSPNLVVERREERSTTPVTMNAFELISKSQGLDLGSLFEKQMVRFLDLPVQ